MASRSVRPLQPLHHDVRRSIRERVAIGDFDNVRVAKAREHAHFLGKPLDEFGAPRKCRAHDLHRHSNAARLLLDVEHDTHPARTKHAADHPVGARHPLAHTEFACYQHRHPHHGFGLLRSARWPARRLPESPPTAERADTPFLHPLAQPLLARSAQKDMPTIWLIHKVPLTSTVRAYFVLISFPSRAAFPPVR